MAVDRWAAERNIETNWLEERTLFEQHKLPLNWPIYSNPSPVSQKAGKIFAAGSIARANTDPLSSTMHTVDPNHPCLFGRAQCPSISRRGKSSLGQVRPLSLGFEHIKTYKETRNGMIGADFSSKFSAFLALGCFPRERYMPKLSDSNTK